MGFFEGLVQGFTGCNVSFSQNAPQYNAPPPTIKLKKQELWTPNSGISLYNKEHPIAPQWKSHQKLTNQGLSPYIGTLHNGKKMIIWQHANFAPINTSKNDNFNTSKPIVIDNGYKEVKPPKKWSELTLGQKIARGFSNTCKFLINPFSTTTNSFSSEPLTGWKKTLAQVGDFGFNTATAFLCPPLFFTSVGAAMSGALVDNCFDTGRYA